MRIAFLGVVALAVSGVICQAPPAHAAETLLLGGVGSLSSSLNDQAPVVTLQGRLTDEAETLDIAYGRVAYGIGRGVAGAVRGASLADAPFWADAPAQIQVTAPGPCLSFRLLGPPPSTISHPPSTSLPPTRLTWPRPSDSFATASHR